MVSTALSRSFFFPLSPVYHKNIQNASFVVHQSTPRSFPIKHLTTISISRSLPKIKKVNETLMVKSNASGSESSSLETSIESRYPAFPTVMDINQIQEILPHRYPFLLVDRVIEYTPGVSAVAIKNVTINESFFPGHFPERPITPGVLTIEAMGQVGCLIVLQLEVGGGGGGGAGDNFFLAGVDKVRFRKPVIAGDTLVMRMTLIKHQKVFGIAKFEGKAYVGGEVVCEGEFLMSIATA